MKFTCHMMIFIEQNTLFGKSTKQERRGSMSGKLHCTSFEETESFENNENDEDEQHTQW